MTAMIDTLQFEWSPFKHPHRLSSDAAFRSQRFCRLGATSCCQLLLGSKCDPSDSSECLSPYLPLPVIHLLTPLLLLLPPPPPPPSPAVPPPRHLLNVLSSFAGSMDAHHIQHIAMLAPYRKQVGCWGCLARACRGCVRVRVGPIEWL